MRYWLWLFFFVFSVTSAWGVTYYVQSTCNGCDANSCSAATNINTPKQTVRSGLGCPSAGDTLYIRGGSYPEQLHALLGTSWPTGTVSNRITIAGYPGETAIINAAWSDTSQPFDMIYIANASYLTFDNLVFDGTNIHPSGGRLTRNDDATSHHLRFQNSIFRNCLGPAGVTDATVGCLGFLGAGDGIEFVNNEFHHLYYAMYLTGSNMLAEGNYIHDTVGYGIHQYSSGCSSCSNNVLRNNFITRTGNGIPRDSGTGCGLILSSGNNNQAYNNVVISAVQGCGIHVYPGTSAAKVYNNTVVGNPDACVDINPGASGTDVRNNLCYNNGTGILDNGSGTSQTENTANGSNPSFTTCAAPSPWFPSGSPYCLGSGSNARGVSHTVSPVFTDIVGNSRGTAGTVTDAGAYLFAAGGPPVTAQTIRWKFDEAAGSTAADSSGNSLTGTLIAAPIHGPGRQGPKALTFNGSSQYVQQTSYAWPSNQSVTVFLWVNTPGGTNGGAFGVITTDANVRFGAHIPHGDNVLYWDYGQWATTGRIFTNFMPYLNKWTHVALVASGTSNFKAIYLNGQLATSSTSSGVPSTTLTGLEVGRWQDGSETLYHTGSIDDFRIETRVWSAAEILADYRRGARASRHGAIAGR